MEDIIRGIEERNLQEARVKTVIELTKLYGDLRVEEERVKRGKVGERHTFDFTDLVKPSKPVAQEGDQPGNKLGKERDQPVKEANKERSWEETEEVKIKSPFMGMKGVGSGSREKEGGEETKRGIFGGMQGSWGSKGQGVTEVVKEEDNAPKYEKTDKKCMIEALKKIEDGGYTFFPTPKDLEKKSCAQLKRLKGFSVKNKYQSILFLNYINLLEIDSNIGIQIHEPNLDTKSLGIAFRGDLANEKVQIKIPNLSKGTITDPEERVRNSEAWITEINSQYTAQDIHFDKESDLLSYTTIFKKT
ncbi:unnamed protein product [Moneuplotes crassus]|uniref:Uncharacterized protein n=1 Tax=Euplotes crassus TaxID=5936 RepID=A0AAD1XPV6_EUPCR|nr:unnamed protein product [Moneuplotes crassus]